MSDDIKHDLLSWFEDGSEQHDIPVSNKPTRPIDPSEAPLSAGTPCTVCGDPGSRRRQNTAFANDEMNWQTLCDDHQEEANEYWADMWSQRY